MADPVKSVGHLGWLKSGGKISAEVFAAGGDVFVVPSSASMLKSGYRAGGMLRCSEEYLKGCGDIVVFGQALS